MSGERLIHCSSCGAANRVPEEKILPGRKPVCGRCKVPLALDNHVVTITDSTFNSEVDHSPLPFLVDMWAAWCGPCRMLAPIVEQVADQMAGRLRVGKLNVDENPTIAARFDIRSLPTLLLMKEGREIDRIIGMQPKAEILRRVEKAI